MAEPKLHSVRLDDDVWEAVRKMDVSLNKFLRGALLDAQKYSPIIENKIKANVTPRPFRGALLKPKDRK